MDDDRTAVKGPKARVMFSVPMAPEDGELVMQAAQKLGVKPTPFCRDALVAAAKKVLGVKK